MIKKDCIYCDKNLQFAALLANLLKIFIFIFFNSSFSNIFAIATFQSGAAFHLQKVCQILLNVQKVIMNRKLSAINKNCTLVNLF